MDEKARRALERYNDAVAKRAAGLGTAHSYVEARAAADSLTQELRKQPGLGLVGVGVGLAADKKDLELIVLVQTSGDTPGIPASHNGFAVRVIVSGDATAL
jgi:hypothetical protein